MMPFFSLFMGITVYLLELKHTGDFMDYVIPSGTFARAVVIISKLKHYNRIKVE